MRKQLGQSLVELAVATPVLLVMLLFTFSTVVMVSDKVIAGHACRQGARLAAEIGGIETNPNGNTPAVDQQIVRNVLAVARAMNYSTILEVDIYKPTAANGRFNPGTDPYDKYDGNGTLVGSIGFPIQNREQIPPNETSIGVRLVWQYNPPTAIAAFSMQLDEYAVMKTAPVIL